MNSKKTSHEPKHFLTVPKGWVYRGEGNCNLVISLPRGKVLHIRKVRRKLALIQWIQNFVYNLIYLLWGLCLWIFKWNIFAEATHIRFYNKVMRPLLGEEYVSEANEVILTWGQVSSLENQLEDLRPEFRKHKRLRPGRATILDDFAFVPDYISSLEMRDDSFAVEIKPKQGWIPLSMKLFPKCIYCMNQYLKLEKGSIQSLSSYCPEDFFSGNDLSMIKAIKALIENPQNNFRIFKNGKLVYGEDSGPLDFVYVIRDMYDKPQENWPSLKESFCYLIKEALTRKFSDPESQTSPCRAKAFCEWDTSMRQKYKNVAKGSVIERIFSVQMLDVEGSSYYNGLLDPKSLNCGMAYVETVLQQIGKFENTTCIKCALMLVGNVREPPKRQIDLRGIPYWISSIANDCSLMLAFRKTQTCSGTKNEPLDNVVSTKYGNFALRIGVFDLFPKKSNVIERHVRRNENIFKAYVENLSLPTRNNLVGVSHLAKVSNRGQFSSKNAGSILNRIKNTLKDFLLWEKKI